VPGTVPSITIEDGVFAFAEVQVQAGGVLRFLGSNPARLYVAGQMEVKGELDCSGDEPAEDLPVGPGGHGSDLPAGGSAGRSGPGGGAGGEGADRFDYTGNIQMLGVGGLPNPGAVTDGRAGAPVGNDPSLGGQGPGGLRFPTDFPVGLLEASWGGFTYNNLITCSGDQIGSPGGGGAYAFSGGIGVAFPPLLPSVQPPDPPAPDTPGGDNSGIPVGDAQFRKLHPEDGNLNGGSGGGGGGASLHTTKTNGQPLQCFNALGGGALQIALLFDHSGAGGGGAGGALQINASNITIDGLVNVAGGAGGHSLGSPTSSQLLPNNSSAAPGGGGSGGALLLQAVDLVVADTPGRISVVGGAGGTQNSPALSFGGAGSTGLVRLESSGALDPLVEAQKVLPFDAALSPASSEFLSIGSLEASQGEALLSAAQSCWLKPVGNFFQVDYAEDDLSDPLNPVPGWDMDLVFQNPSIPLVSYRGNNPLLPPGQSFETFFGTDLKGTFPAPLVVRFQGVRAVKAIEDFCNVDISLGGDTVISGSLTGWVRHPDDLNTYWLDAGLSPQEAEKLRPNMLRFRIVFDDSTVTPGLFSTLLQGVTNFRVTAQPD